MPEPTKIGDNSARMISAETVFDPNRGEQYQQVWEGSEEALRVQASNARTLGGRARCYQHDGPIYRMSVVFGDPQDGSQEQPVDQWNLDTEYIQEDLRNNPKVIAAAATSQTLTQWIRDIKAALKKDPVQSLPDFYLAKYGSSTAADEALAIYDLYARGVEAHEIKRFVLRRRRKYSLKYAQRSKLRAVELVYTTAGLVAAYAIPAAIAALLPANPNFTPSGTVWAWKERQNNSAPNEWQNKIEESQDWVFAAWSTLLYDVA